MNKIIDCAPVANMGISDLYWIIEYCGNLDYCHAGNSKEFAINQENLNLIKQRVENGKIIYETKY